MAELTHFNEGFRSAACGVKQGTYLTDKPERTSCTRCRASKAWKLAWEKRVNG